MKSDFSEYESSMQQAIGWKEKLLPLPFTIFFFINWYYFDKSTLSHLVSAVSFALFLVLYFWSYSGRRAAIIASAIMVAMTPVVSIYNPGANCYAIFGCACIAHSQAPRLTYLYVAVSLVIFACVTWWLDYPWMAYFSISAVMTIGVSAMGLSQRVFMKNVFRERASQEEIHRLSRLSEHSRIGQDMHDLLGHSLTGIHLKSKLVNKLLDMGQIEEAKSHLSDIESAVQTTMADVRKAVLEYKNLSLEEEALAQKEYLAKLGIGFEYEIAPVAMSSRVESDLVMLLREAVNNTLKYAKATRVRFQLIKEDEQIKVQFKDNGKGLDHTKMYEGSGLEGMRQRVKQHAGQIEFKNASGLSIEVSIPVLQPSLAS